MPMRQSRIACLAVISLVVFFVCSPCAAEDISAMAAPPAPGNFRYTLEGSILTLFWDSSSGASGYNFGVGFQPGVYAAWAPVGNVTQLGPIDISVVPAGTYYLVMKASSGGGESTPSNELVIAWTPAPKNLTYSLDGSQFTISWDPVAGASDYIFSVGFGAGTYAATARMGNVTQIGPFDISLVPNGTYYLAMQAVGGTTVSDYSNEVAVKVGTAASQPVSISSVTDALFIGMGKYDPALAPALTQAIISTFQAGGMNGLADLAAAAKPQLVSKIPNGIMINYGSGYTTSWGATLTGSVAITHSNVVTSGSRTTGNFSVVADNVTRNGVFIATALSRAPSMRPWVLATRWWETSRSSAPSAAPPGRPWSAAQPTLTRPSAPTTPSPEA